MTHTTTRINHTYCMCYTSTILSLLVCVCVCVCMRVHACMCACVCVACVFQSTYHMYNIMHSIFCMYSRQWDQQYNISMEYASTYQHRHFIKATTLITIEGMLQCAVQYHTIKVPKKIISKTERCVIHRGCCCHKRQYYNRKAHIYIMLSE